jgi:TatD DNase family protein
MTFTDTHCHIHEAAYPDQEGALTRAAEAGISRMICVGTDEITSAEAVAFAANYDNVWASLGLHPHDAAHGLDGIGVLEKLLTTYPTPQAGKIVAIGECGLDYFYENSPRDQQIEMLEQQLQLAKDHGLPVIFHVREAFDDFWPIFDSFSGLRGVLHSFTDSVANRDAAITRGLYIGVNGISTFTKDESQREMFASIPLEKLLFETDAPFLTPVPHRGMVNEPAFITHVAHHIANLRSINLKELSRATERNATTLFFSN